MSKYTISIQEVCESIYNKKKVNDLALPDIETFFKGDNPDDIIKAVRSDIFDFNYPLPNDSSDKKIELETKILKHYYMYEIGFDTFGRFKLALDEKLNLIIPYYNEFYKTVEMNKENPLSNNDIVVTQNTTGSVKGSNTLNSNGSSNTKQVFEDTPTSELGMNNYATNITTNTGSGENTQTGNNTSENNETLLRTTKGLSNYSKQDMISRYRENILNIDEAIINELSDLFLLIY